MVYVDFTFYNDEYHGSSISLSTFDNLALRASARIDQLTFNRANAVVVAGTETDTIEKIKLATCAVADELQRQDEVSVNGLIQSEKVGQHSVTYATPSNSASISRVSNIAKVYLWNTDLMFKGLNDDEN